MESLASEATTSRSLIKELVLASSDNIVVVAKISISLENLLLYL